MVRSYKNNMITGASPMGLVLISYDLLIKSLDQAKLATEQQDFEHESEFIGRAARVITDLRYALDMEKGGEISQNLASLYHFMTQRLLEGQAKDTVKAIEDVRKLAASLREAWQAVANQEHPVAYAVGA
ncbi:MAG: flagellar export chaperone FliS [Zetaproteobacteria bacterium]|nr:flagellar export chaperone FliS [Zetaproteobacteria bacterium]